MDETDRAILAFVHPSGQHSAVWAELHFLIPYGLLPQPLLEPFVCRPMTAVTNPPPAPFVFDPACSRVLPTTAEVVSLHSKGGE